MNTKGIDLSVKASKKCGYTFPSRIGIANGVLYDGRGIHAMHQASGTDSNTGRSTFVELGPCTPERQQVRQGESKERLKVDFDAGSATLKVTRNSPSVQ